jgi:hypothetical protein
MRGGICPRRSGPGHLFWPQSRLAVVRPQRCPRSPSQGLEKPSRGDFESLPEPILATPSVFGSWPAESHVSGPRIRPLPTHPVDAGFGPPPTHRGPTFPQECSRSCGYWFVCSTQAVSCSGPTLSNRTSSTGSNATETLLSLRFNWLSDLFITSGTASDCS